MLNVYIKHLCKVHNRLSYLNFIRFNNVFDIDDNIFLKEFSPKLIIRFKILYDIYEDFIVLKNAKKCLFKLNNN